MAAKIVVKFSVKKLMPQHPQFWAPLGPRAPPRIAGSAGSVVTPLAPPTELDGSASPSEAAIYSINYKIQNKYKGEVHKININLSWIEYKPASLIFSAYH